MDEKEELERSGSGLAWDIGKSFAWGVLLGIIIILCVIFAPEEAREFIYTEF